MDELKTTSQLADHEARLKIVEAEVIEVRNVKHKHANVLQQHTGKLEHIESDFEKHVKNIEESYNDIKKNIKELNIFHYKSIGVILALMVITSGIMQILFH